MLAHAGKSSAMSRPSWTDARLMVATLAAPTRPGSSSDLPTWGGTLDTVPALGRATKFQGLTLKQIPGAL